MAFKKSKLPYMAPEQRFLSRYIKDRYGLVARECRISLVERRYPNGDDIIARVGADATMPPLDPNYRVSGPEFEFSPLR